MEELPPVVLSFPKYQQGRTLKRASKTVDDLRMCFYFRPFDKLDYDKGGEWVSKDGMQPQAQALADQIQTAF
jgi:hypothetical protein